ncbi:hypothetical protein AAFF_G00029000 [Aldrovandia affinis]|uniref:Uncharacterized protein n=1 Tax=Aldrovandia affinis TaxID=143900 RepID=A0AAD7S4A4_9TELE|nr:hypothetical protein AAFF_G00029000 [Aldrovandia affinis]
MAHWVVSFCNTAISHGIRVKVGACLKRSQTLHSQALRDPLLYQRDGTDDGSEQPGFLLASAGFQLALAMTSG